MGKWYQISGQPLSIPERDSKVITEKGKCLGEKEKEYLESKFIANQIMKRGFRLLHCIKKSWNSLRHHLHTKYQ